MPKSNHALPDALTLNGADYFCLQLDGLMWRSNGKRNVCTLVVTLTEHLTLEHLQHQLSQRPAYQWLCQLRLKTGVPFSLAQWRRDTEAALPAILEHPLPHGSPLPDNLLSVALDIKKQSAFKIDLLHRADAGSVLIFRWHHALMDAHGGELFIRYLGMNLPFKQSDWIAGENRPLPLKISANIASQMKQFLYDISQLPLLTLYQKSTVKPQVCYRVLSFTAQQSHQINARAQQMGAGFLISAFYLAAVTFAVANVQKQRGAVSGDVLVPVPVDRRKRGAGGAILGNQLSFLFYRLPNAILGNVQACTTEILAQMKMLMRAQKPEQHAVMMDFLRRMPGFFYRHLLKLPTQGLMASFFYSDTGDSLQSFDALFGKTVSGAIHYPPNTYPPGMTLVSSRFQGALQLTISYMTPDINAAEVELLITSLQQALLGEMEG